MRPKASTGQMLWLDMEVPEGTCRSRHVYDHLNLVNPNPTAEDIAQRTLSAICHAVGKLQVRESEELHFLPMLIRVAVQPSGYNAVKGYKAVQRTLRVPTPAAANTSPRVDAGRARHPPPVRRHPGSGAPDRRDGSAVGD